MTQYVKTETRDTKGDIKNPVYDIYVWKDGKSSPGTK